MVVGFKHSWTPDHFPTNYLSWKLEMYSFSLTYLTVPIPVQVKPQSFASKLTITDAWPLFPSVLGAPSSLVVDFSLGNPPSNNDSAYQAMAASVAMVPDLFHSVRWQLSIQEDPFAILQVSYLILLGVEPSYSPEKSGWRTSVVTDTRPGDRLYWVT